MVMAKWQVWLKDIVPRYTQLLTTKLISILTSAMFTNSDVDPNM